MLTAEQIMDEDADQAEESLDDHSDVPLQELMAFQETSQHGTLEDGSEADYAPGRWCTDVKDGS